MASVFDRDTIERVAEGFIAHYPKWTNKQINTQLRTDFAGRYLTKKTYTKLRALDIAYLHPTMTGNEVTILRDEKFNDHEVKNLLEGWSKTTRTIDSPAFVAMRESRIKWWNSRVRYGWKPRQIWRAIANYYDKPYHNPFDWLRKEYKPARRIDLAQFRSAWQKRSIASAKAKREKAIKATAPMYHLLKYKPRQPVTVTLKGKSVTF